MNGHFLVNGAPPSTLPEEIRKHPLFLRGFGDIDFEIDEDIYGMRRSLKPVLERYYCFQKIEDELLIFEEVKNDHGDWETLRLLNNENIITDWGQDLPVGLKKLYSHWQSKGSKAIILRPIPFRKRWIYYLYHKEGLYKVPRADLAKSVESLIDTSISYDRHLHLDNDARGELLGVYSKFDTIEYVHPYVTQDKSFKVVLARYNIAFVLRKNSSSYECLDFLDYKLSSVQQFSDRIYGFLQLFDYGKF